MSKIIVGHLALHTDGVAYYGKNGIQIVFPYPIHLGVGVIREVGDEAMRFELLREGKKMMIIGYDDDKLGMVLKTQIHRAHAMPMVIEAISRKFKVSSILSKMQTITKNGVEITRRIWIDEPDTVDEEQLRRFLCKGRKVIILA